MKCKRLVDFEQLHTDWSHRIQFLKDGNNPLWKQKYLAALPSRFLEFMKTHMSGDLTNYGYGVLNSGNFSYNQVVYAE